MKLISNKIYLLTINLITVILSYSIFHYVDLTTPIPFLHPYKLQINIAVYTTLFSYIRNYFEEKIRSKSTKINLKFSSYKDKDEIFKTNLNIEKYNNARIYLIVKILGSNENLNDLYLKVKFPPKITAQFEGKITNEKNELILPFKEFANSSGRYPLPIDIMVDAESLSSQSTVIVEIIGQNWLLDLTKEDLAINID
ncbi:hypothetical protein ACN68I_00365 [Aerococcus viridans]|uniref:hypothetical protein n=1 Tax=Aerococcus viridans TaxID=1377 RepID=UPI003B2237E6